MISACLRENQTKDPVPTYRLSLRGYQIVCFTIKQLVASQQKTLLPKDLVTYGKDHFHQCHYSPPFPATAGGFI